MTEGKLLIKLAVSVKAETFLGEVEDGRILLKCSMDEASQKKITKLLAVYTEKQAKLLEFFKAAKGY